MELEEHHTLAADLAVALAEVDSRVGLADILPGLEGKDCEAEHRIAARDKGYVQVAGSRAGLVDIRPAFEGRDYGKELRIAGHNSIGEEVVVEVDSLDRSLAAEVAPVMDSLAARNLLH